MVAISENRIPVWLPAVGEITVHCRSVPATFSDYPLQSSASLPNVDSVVSRGISSCTSRTPYLTVPPRAADAECTPRICENRMMGDTVTARDIAARLPDIDILRRRCLAAATLDAILSPVWDGRCYSFTADWGGDASAAEIRDGCGNHCFIVFTADGVFIIGFDHESPMSPYRRADARHSGSPELWPGLVDGLPAVFTPFLTEPAFTGPGGVLAMTFCIWREHHDSRWCTGPVDFTALDRYDTDGAHEMLGVLCDPTPAEAYGTFAFEYFEVDLDPVALEHIFALGPITDQLVRSINPSATLDDLARDLASSGYPTGQPHEDRPAMFHSTPPIPKETRNVGTWGTGPFDNDGAGDWSDAFAAVAVGDRPGFLKDTLSKWQRTDYLDNDACQEIVAAAATIAAALPGGPPIDSEFGPKTLTAEPGFAVSEDLREAAADALRAVAAPQSEWAQLWAETEDESEAHWSVTQLITDLQPYKDWAPFPRLEDAVAAHLRDPAVALEALGGIVEFDAVQAFTIERRVTDEDWGRSLYQEIALIDDERLIVWMGDDIRDDDVPLFSSEARVIPLSWVYDASLDERYRLQSGARTLHSVHLHLDVAIIDVATRVPDTDKTELRTRGFYFSKAVDDGGQDQMVRLAAFGRAAAKLVRRRG